MREDLVGHRRLLRVLAWWIALLGMVVVAMSICASTWWLLDEADKGVPDRRAERRIDAIRTGLSVGVGTGGALALLLAACRQWLHERTHAHQEDVAATTEFDASPISARNVRSV